MEKQRAAQLVVEKAVEKAFSTADCSVAHWVVYWAAMWEVETVELLAYTLVGPKETKKVVWWVVDSDRQLANAKVLK